MEPGRAVLRVRLSVDVSNVESEYNVAEDVSSKLIATDRLLPMCTHGRGLAYVYMCMCAQSEADCLKTVLVAECVCACAGPMADSVCVWSQSLGLSV